MRKIFVILLYILTVINATKNEEFPETEWEEFKLQHNKHYKTHSEELFRKKIFLQNLETISKHNQHYDKGLIHHQLGMNKYGDLTKKEFSEAMFGTFSSVYSIEDREGSTFVAPEVTLIPDSIDWREKGAVSEVQSQYPCGACWAFSAAGALEGQVFLKTGRLITLSKQNLLDCTRDDDNLGCAGGYPKNAFKYVKREGIDSESSYPYEGIELRCRYNKSASVTTDKGFMNIEKTERKLKIAVATIGPISVIIDGSPLQFYDEGVIYDNKCSNDPRKLNHAVLVVGYGRCKRGGPYWIVKNSWGTDFGEDGYFRLARNRRNLCGIATAATVPIV